MNERESILTHSVKEAILNASALGEDLEVKTGIITEVVTWKALKAAAPVTKEKVEEIAWDVLKGALQAAKILGVETESFLEKASSGIIKGIKESESTQSSFIPYAIKAMIESTMEAGERTFEMFKEIVKKNLERRWNILPKNR